MDLANILALSFLSPPGKSSEGLIPAPWDAIYLSPASGRVYLALIPVTAQSRRERNLRLHCLPFKLQWVP